MRPGDGRAQGLLARVSVPSALEHVEALGEALEDLLRRKHARSRGGELERERQVVERSAQLVHVLVGICPGPRAEQLDRVRLGER